MSDLPPATIEAATPALSVMMRNFSADDPGPGGWEPLLAQARSADAAGIDRLVVADHVVFGENLEAYADPRSGGTAGGKQPTGPDGHWLEPLTLLSVIAGSTRSIRLQTGILIAALRRPAVLAKSLATATLYQHGSRFAQALFDQQERAQRPAMLKQFALRDFYKALEYDDNLPRVHMMVARLEATNTGEQPKQESLAKGVRSANRAVELLRQQKPGQLHSRKLRSFAEVAFQ